jgi:hypothetical protein
MTNLERQNAIDEIPALVSQLQKIVTRLEELFPGRHFTLDGHLVGSIAEVIASYMYDLELLPSSQQCHDGRCQKTGVNVQIKGTQRKRVSMYSEADHLIVLHLANGQAEEVYNGPGSAPWHAAGPMAKNGQRSISVRKLLELAREVRLDKRLAIVRTISNSSKVAKETSLEQTSDGETFRNYRFP